MARVCKVTGKRPMTGNNVSHANNKTKRRFLPNLQYRKFWVESENRWVRLRISNAALRTIDKVGIDAVLADLRARLAERRQRLGDAPPREAHRCQRRCAVRGVSCKAGLALGGGYRRIGAAIR